jgi:hypothetical protein
MDKPDYTSQTFYLNLPAGNGQGNIPNLLRHLAKNLDAMGDTFEISDIVLHSDQDKDGNEWPYVAVYYSIHKE